MSALERLGSMDMTWLQIEQKTNLMQVLGLLILETPLDRSVLEERLRKDLLPLERFSQQVLRDTAGAVWETHQVELNVHIVEVTLPAGDEKARGVAMDRISVHVWLPGQAEPTLAGEFWHDDQVGRFLYASDYLAAQLPALAPDLPLRPKPQRSPAAMPSSPCSSMPDRTRVAVTSSSANWSARSPNWKHCHSARPMALAISHWAR